MNGIGPSGDRHSHSSIDVSWAPWIALWLALAVTVFTTVADPDLWGHLRFGLDAMSTHRLTPIDPYSFTQDVPWINHEWLSEIWMALAYAAGGTPALILLKVVLVLATFAVVTSAYGRIAFVASGAALVLLTWAARPITLSVRPQLWTLLCLSVLCRMLLMRPQRTWLAIVPAMFLLWVNFHGGWIVGFAVLVVWTACHVFSRSPDVTPSFAGSLIVLSAAATLVNPYGWQMWKFLWETVRMSRDASEWQPIWTSPGISWVPTALVTAIAIYSLLSRYRPSIDRIAVIVMLGYGAIRVRRTAPLFVAGSLILLAPALTAFVSTWPARLRTFTAPSRAGACLAAIPVIWLAFAGAHDAARTMRCIPIQGDWIPDQQAVLVLKSNLARGRLINWFSWGHYALWHLSPSLKISMDGRRETVYSERVLKEHDALDRVEPAGVAFLQRVKPEYLWMPSSHSALKEWVRHHGYRIDVDTDRSFIAVRADVPVLSKSPSLQPSSCFPGL